MTTPTVAARPRPTLKQVVQERVTEGKEDHFRKWLAKNDHIFDIRDRQVATTALSTYIEERVKATEGTYFTNPETVNIVIAKRHPTTFELVESKAIKITVPGWMTDFIMSFPNAPWARG